MKRCSPGTCSITWMSQNVSAGTTASLMETALSPVGVVAYRMSDGVLMSKACAPPLPYGLSIPGAQDEPGGTTPPPRSSVTNMRRPSCDGSASCEIDTPWSDRTWLFELQLRTSVPGGPQSRPGWLKVPTKVQPVARSVRAASMPPQSVTLAPVRVPAMTEHGNAVPWTRPPFVNPATSRMSVALTPAQ